MRYAVRRMYGIFRQVHLCNEKVHYVWLRCYYKLKKKGIPCIPFNPFLALKGTANYRQRTAGAAPDTDADGRTAESGEASGADERTGWETEREAFFSVQHQTAQTESCLLYTSKQFYAFLTMLMPDWKQRKEALDKSATFWL